jgi:hypothetical protein
MGGCHNSCDAARTTPLCLRECARSRECIEKELVEKGGTSRPLECVLPLLTKFPLGTFFLFSFFYSFMCIQCAPLAVFRNTIVPTYIRIDQGDRLGGMWRLYSVKCSSRCSRMLWFGRQTLVVNR